MGLTLDQSFRDDWSIVVASLVGFLGEFDLAEEAAQEAFARAAEHWPRHGIPDAPRAWLLSTARRCAIDRIRRRQNLDAKTRLLAASPETVEDVDVRSSPIPDQRLELIFTCCHPALALDAQVALTLRTVGGMTTAEIAAAFLVPEATMAKRLVRAKHKIRAAGIPFRVPPAELLTSRIAAVLAVVYLVFIEGWSSARPELVAEALWLGRALTELLPEQGEVHALLALMLLHDSRRDARTVDGELVLLADQDPTRWDAEEIALGHASFARALALGVEGPYVLQAAIASAHAMPVRDWRHIAVLYGRLAQLTPSPIVALNRAAAIAEVEGPAAGLELVERLDLGTYPYFHGSRAELLRRLGRFAEAAGAFDRALALVGDGPQRRFYERRRSELEAGPRVGPAVAGLAESVHSVAP